jgi:hypothetical protein
MDILIEQLTPKEWEKFCARMLRYHYGVNNFWEVPDTDQGDLGLEFFIIDGTLYQCYYPDKNADMAAYKQKVQKKIRNDLQKLKTNEVEIAKILDGVVDKVRRWVLLIPEMKSKELIKYCNTKKKELLKSPPTYIDTEDFQVKIDTADSFPDGALFAKSVHAKAVDIPLVEVTDIEKAIWQEGNIEFSANIERKSNTFMGENATRFKDTVVKKYIQIEKFLDDLRINYPDLHELVEDSARAQLERIRNDSLFENALDKQFVSNIVKGNEKAFSKHTKYMSDSNTESLSFGYLSKWLAECYMDFSNE